jgi:hypothetical protein
VELAACLVVRLNSSRHSECGSGRREHPTVRLANCPLSPILENNGGKKFVRHDRYWTHEGVWLGFSSIASVFGAHCLYSLGLIDYEHQLMKNIGESSMSRNSAALWI